MPQIWLTDEELGEHLRCDPIEARGIAMVRGWTRKRSRDGLSRTCLPFAIMIHYIASAAREISGRRPELLEYK